MSPKGFIPSVLSPNLMFLTSFAKSGYVLSTFLHYDPSAGCLSIVSSLSLLRALCHCINWVCALFAKYRFKRGIMGKYHITLVGGSLLLRLILDITRVITLGLIP